MVPAHRIPGEKRVPSARTVLRTHQLERRPRNVDLRAPDMPGVGNPRRHSCRIGRSERIQKVSVVSSGGSSSRVARLHAERFGIRVRVRRSVSPSGHQEFGTCGRGSPSPYGNDFSTGLHGSRIELFHVFDDGVPVGGRYGRSGIHGRSHVVQKRRVQHVRRKDSEYDSRGDSGSFQVSVHLWDGYGRRIP